MVAASLCVAEKKKKKHKMLLHPEMMKEGSVWFVIPAEERRVGLIFIAATLHVTRK